MTSEDLLRKICTSHFIVRVRKGYSGFYCERELETEQNCNILTTTLMAVSVVSFSFSRAAQSKAQGLSFLLSAGFLYHILSPMGLRNYWGPRGPLRLGVTFPTTSYQQFLWSPTHQEPQGSPLPGFLYHILSATSLDPNSSGAPRVPSAGLSLPHLISNFSGHQLSDFLSSQSYIIVQRPLNRPLNPWNGMFDHHQAEITDMQFTGCSLPVHHSVAALWDLHLVPYYQPSSPVQFLLINGHWDVSLPLSLNGMFARAEGQNTTIWHETIWW